MEAWVWSGYLFLIHPKFDLFLLPDVQNVACNIKFALDSSLEIEVSIFYMLCYHGTLCLLQLIHINTMR